MIKKLIYLPKRQVDLINSDADEREISFTEVVRRIIDKHYSSGTYEISTDSTCIQGIS